eukprot:COSAG04_NODE_928_length_9368_cov_3.520984_4_plen_127_part_00
MRVHVIPFSYIQRVECTKSRRPVRLPVMARELFEPQAAHAPLVALQALSAEVQSGAPQPTSAGLIAFFCRYLQQRSDLIRRIRAKGWSAHLMKSVSSPVRMTPISSPSDTTLWPWLRPPAAPVAAV